MLFIDPEVAPDVHFTQEYWGEPQLVLNEEALCHIGFANKRHPEKVQHASYENARFLMSCIESDWPDCAVNRLPEDLKFEPNVAHGDRSDGPKAVLLYDTETLSRYEFRDEQEQRRFVDYRSKFEDVPKEVLVPGSGFLSLLAAEKYRIQEGINPARNTFVRFRAFQERDGSAIEYKRFISIHPTAVTGDDRLVRLHEKLPFGSYLQPFVTHQTHVVRPGATSEVARKLGVVPPVEQVRRIDLERFRTGQRVKEQQPVVDTAASKIGDLLRGLLPKPRLIPGTN